MKRKTAISWTARTWNPVHGCTRHSTGCDFCYACVVSWNKEWGTPKKEGDYRGLPFRGMNLTYKKKDKDKPPRWTGNIVLSQNPKVLNAPLSWKTPELIFGDSMFDIFHERMPIEWIHKIFSVVSLANQHYFQYLTKRSDRLLALSPRIDWSDNLIMGVSIETNDFAHRLDDLRACGAKKKYASLEPLLGALPDLDVTGIDQIIVGGESGKGFREMKVEWVEEILAKCRETGTAFYMKQDCGPKQGMLGRFADLPHEWPEWGPDFAAIIKALTEDDAK